MTTSPIAYFNGQLMPADKITISPLDRGFIFGDGVYEMIPVYGRKLFRFDEHMARLARSLGKVRIASQATAVISRDTPASFPVPRSIRRSTVRTHAPRTSAGRHACRRAFVSPSRCRRRSRTSGASAIATISRASSTSVHASWVPSSARSCGSCRTRSFHRQAVRPTDLLSLFRADPATRAVLQRPRASTLRRRSL